MPQVQSKLIAAVNHNPTTHELRIAFNDGSEWAYQNVSPQRYGLMLASSSIGAHFIRHIKPKYRGKRIR